MPTPLFHRPSDLLSNRIKFLSASAVVGVLAGYFIFGNSDRRADVTVTPEDTRGIPLVALREMEAPSTKATNMTVESRAVPEGQMASLEPVVRLDIKANGGADAGELQTLQEREKQLLRDDGHDATCFPSTSAVLMHLPGARPSWTLRKPLHEGMRCWYPAARTKAEAEAPSPRAGGITVESRPEPEGEMALSQPAGRLIAGTKHLVCRAGSRRQNIMQYVYSLPASPSFVDKGNC